MAPIAILLLYIGTLNTLLSYGAGTCTQGNASHLAGVIFSVIPYLIGSFCWTKSTYGRGVLVICLPVIGVVLWQAVFAVCFAIEIFWRGASACDVLQSATTHPPDGNERTLTVLWLVSAAINFTTFLLAISKTINRTVATSKRE
jgi:hypothetical protein